MMNIVKVRNYINGSFEDPQDEKWINKRNPHNGKIICEIACSSKKDVDKAVNAAGEAFVEWSEKTPIERGNVISEIVILMKEKSDILAKYS